MANGSIEEEVHTVYVTYQSNYNGCTVGLVTIDEQEVNVDEFLQKANQLERLVVDRASADVITSGRFEGMFNGCIEELEQYARQHARLLFGDAVRIVFQDDEFST